MATQFYDGTKLLSLKDLDGNQPELFLCTTNRSGGKTTYFSRLLVNRFLKNKEKFALLFRFKYDLVGCAEKFFKDIQGLFFPEYEMTAKPFGRGEFFQLYLNDELCGYALAINCADTIKRYSHTLSDTSRIFFDEFQSETEHYASNEIQKFISIHTSIARGQGKQARYVPVYMCGNYVSILNPYFVELGISERLRHDTKFLRGHGFVLEQGFVKSASDAQLTTGFNKAFKNNQYVAYSAQNVYLNDNLSFIAKPDGKSRYVATVKADGKNFSIREYPDAGIVYVSKHVDASCPTRISATTEDHQINYVMRNTYKLFLMNLKILFDKGCFRFQDLESKAATFKLLGGII